MTYNYTWLEQLQHYTAIEASSIPMSSHAEKRERVEVMDASSAWVGGGRLLPAIIRSLFQYCWIFEHSLLLHNSPRIVLLLLFICDYGCGVQFTRLKATLFYYLPNIDSNGRWSKWKWWFRRTWLVLGGWLVGVRSLLLPPNKAIALFVLFSFVSMCKCVQLYHCCVNVHSIGVYMLFEGGN